MSLLDPAGATAELPAPLFELPTKVVGLGLSTWIGTAMLAIGISRVGPGDIAADFNAGGYGIYVMIAAYVAFIATALLVQTQSRAATDHRLHTNGIFSFTRNPAYLAFFLPLASLAYFSTHTAVAAIVIYVTAMNLIVIRREERDLHRQFGAAFTAYRNAVPRWFA